jgi:hypothetical protein
MMKLLVNKSEKVSVSKVPNFYGKNWRVAECNVNGVNRLVAFPAKAKGFKGKKGYFEKNGNWYIFDAPELPKKKLQ